MHAFCAQIHAAPAVASLSIAGIEPRPRYHFAIGSVDSFERKLDDAQRELGVGSAAFVPVKYSQEV